MNIDELRKIVESATRGGWIADGSRFNHYLGRGIGQVWGVNWRNDLQFITTFHPLQTLALLDRVEKAERALHRVREQHQPRMNSMSALYPEPLCSCQSLYPCPTIRTLEGDE